MQVDVDESTPSTVSVTDLLVCETDPAYVRPLPYQRLIDYLDILMSGHPAGTGAGPEAPVASELRLLNAQSVDVDEICTLIYSMWNRIYTSDGDTTSNLKNFVFAEIPILAEKWGCSIGPFTQGTGASTAWMLQGDSFFSKYPILYAWKVYDYDRWHFVTNFIGKDFSAPDRYGDLIDGRGSCFNISQRFLSGPGKKTLYKHIDQSSSLSKEDAIALMQDFERDILGTTKLADRDLYYETEAFLVDCDRGKYDPGANPDPDLKARCMKLLENQHATGVICERARLWVHTIVSNYYSPDEQQLTLLRELAEKLSYVTLDGVMPSQQIDQYGKPRVFPFVQGANAYAQHDVELTIAHASLSGFPNRYNYRWSTCLLTSKTHFVGEDRSLEYESEVGCLHIDEDLRLIQFSKLADGDVPATWNHMSAVGGTRRANKQAFVSWLMDGNSHGGISTYMLARYKVKPNVNPKPRKNIAPVQQKNAYLVDKPTLKCSISVFRHSLVYGIMRAFNICKLGDVPSDTNPLNVVREQLEGCFRAATDGVHFFVDQKLDGMYSTEELPEFNHEERVLWDELRDAWDEHKSGQLRSLLQDAMMEAQTTDNNDNRILWNLEDTIESLRGMQQMHAWSKWIRAKETSEIPEEAYQCGHCRLKFVRMGDYSAHMLYSKRCMQASFNNGQYYRVQAMQTDLHSALYEDAKIIYSSTPSGVNAAGVVYAKFRDGTIKETTLRSVRPVRGSFIHFPRAVMVYNAVRAFENDGKQMRFIGSFALALHRYFLWTANSQISEPMQTTRKSEELFWLILKWIDSGHDIDLVIQNDDEREHVVSEHWQPIQYESFDQRSFEKTTKSTDDKTAFIKQRKKLLCLMHAYEKTDAVSLLKVQFGPIAALDDAETVPLSHWGNVGVEDPPEIFSKLCRVVTEFQNTKYTLFESSVSLLKTAYDIGPFYTRIEEWYNICMACRHDEITRFDASMASTHAYLRAHMLDARHNKPYLGKRIRNKEEATTFHGNIGDSHCNFLMANPLLLFKYAVFVHHFGLPLNVGLEGQDVVRLRVLLQSMIGDGTASVANDRDLVNVQYIPDGYITYMVRAMRRESVILSRLQLIRDLLDPMLLSDDFGELEKAGSLWNELLWNSNDLKFMRQQLEPLDEAIKILLTENELSPKSTLADPLYFYKFVGRWNDHQWNVVRHILGYDENKLAGNRYYPWDIDDDHNPAECQYEIPWGVHLGDFEALIADPNSWIGRRKLVAFFMSHAMPMMMEPRVMNYYLRHSYYEQFGEPPNMAILYNKVLTTQILPCLQDFVRSDEEFNKTWSDRPGDEDFENNVLFAIHTDCTESTRVDRIYLGKLFQRGATCSSCRDLEEKKAPSRHKDSHCECYVPQSHDQQYTPFKFESPPVWDYSDSNEVKPTSGVLCGLDEGTPPRAFVLTLSCPIHTKVRVQLKQETQSLLDMLPTPESDNSPGMSCECCMQCGSYRHPSGSDECPL